MMNYNDFLNRIIEDGIIAVRADYKEGDKLDGAIAAFEACRNQSPQDLVELLVTANKFMNYAMMSRHDNYWYFRCYQAEVEWTLNVVCAMLYNQGAPQLVSYLPTARGMMKAAEILGVASE